MPDFGGWAEGAAATITGAFGRAIQWVKDRFAALLKHLPGWAKDRMGLNITMAADSAQAIQNTALAPGSAAAAGMSQSSSSSVELNAKAEFNIHTSDPIAAGNQAAARQSQVNADLVRHARGAAR